MVKFESIFSIDDKVKHLEVCFLTVFQSLDQHSDTSFHSQLIFLAKKLIEKSTESCQTLIKITSDKIYES